MCRSWGATLTVNVLLPNGRPLGGVVVTVNSVNGPVHPAAPVQAVMDQINRAFAPDLLVIPVDSTVAFPNSDSVSHQIYSFSPAKRFQLPLYRGKPYPPVAFDQPGVVTMGCNIHDEMLAYIVITDAAFFGRTNAAGSWSADVPGGGYRISIWHPRIRDDAKDLSGELTISEPNGGTLTLQPDETVETRATRGTANTRGTPTEPRHELAPQ